MADIEKNGATSTVEDILTKMPTASILSVDSDKSDEAEESTTPGPGLRRSVTVKTPKKWPSEPEHLKQTKGWSIALNVYDAFFVLLPIGLMIKTTLCVVAHEFDGRLNRLTLDYVSRMTTQLLYINNQVSL